MNDVVQACPAPFSLIADGDMADGVLELVDLDRQGTRMKISFVRHGCLGLSLELEERSYTGFG